MFDVEFVVISRTQRRSLTEYICVIIFSTAEQAATIQSIYNGHILNPFGTHLLVLYPKPPQRIMGSVSWDGGRPGGHNTKRDQGSAVRTNFEKVRLKEDSI